ncbi:MAG: hypothetical protein DMF75_14020 [Acidobacteria bacterium]|nr:MAG: hypothetical protein DMF75_14020 [Acidobacteriota bacterium]
MKIKNKIQLTGTMQIEYLIARLSGYWFLRPIRRHPSKGNRLLQVRATQYVFYDREDFPRQWIGIDSRSNFSIISDR